MKSIISFALILLTAAGCDSIAKENTSDVTQNEDGKNLIWFRQSAGDWVEALPLGNGRMGAMVYGSVEKEQLKLNEESLWAGEPVDVYPDNFSDHLDKLQKLIIAGKIPAARDYGMKNMTKSPTSFRSYEPLGDLWIEFDHKEKFENYSRRLDLQTGIVTVQYDVGDVRFKREYFISAVDDVMAMRLTASKPGMIDAKVSLTRAKDMKVTAVGNNRLHMDGQIVDIAAPMARDDNSGGSGPGGEHMKFAARQVVNLLAGKIKADGEKLIIRKADQVVILFTAATDYNLEILNYDRSIDPGKKADAILARASKKTWDRIRRDHTNEHKSYFDRVAIELGNSAQDSLPTDLRLEAVKNGGFDPGLTETYFQFGRYLLMSCSRRPSRLPANLQGIWSKKMWAPWEADYHLNINLQMNYWPADLCNLSETLEPFINWFDLVTKKGEFSAKELYGADGWVCFMSTNPFGRTTPAGSNKSSQYMNGVLDPLTGTWMAMTLWRHYEFTRDKTFLAQQAYPVLKGAALFLLDYLIEDDEGNLAIIPSTSPENKYIHPKTGDAMRMTVSSTYHTTLVRVIFEAVIQSSNLLAKDDRLRQRLETALKKIPPVRIGADGTIQEWIEDYREDTPGHRHISHLLGLHPFSTITQDDKDFFNAAGKTIARRLSHGGGHTGWSRAWIINFYSRLFDGNSAHKHIQLLFAKSTLPNLFDTHPPFQIDGNFAATAGIAEMLIQSHADTIHLLPALPDAWPNGRVKGLCARGGFVVDIYWKDKTLLKAVITSRSGGPAILRYADKALEIDTSPGKVYTVRRTPAGDLLPE